jgi:hypothetical protein
MESGGNAVTPLWEVQLDVQLIVKLWPAVSVPEDET